MGDRCHLQLVLHGHIKTVADLEKILETYEHANGENFPTFSVSEEVARHLAINAAKKALGVEP